METGLANRNVVIFSARYLPSVGGVEFFSKNLGNQLASMGYDVLVVTTEPTDDASGDGRRGVGEGTFEVFRLGSWGPQRAPFVRRDARYRALQARLGGLGGFHALINTRLYDLSQVAAQLCERLGVRPVLIDHGTGYIAFKNPVLSVASKVAEHAMTARLRRHPIDCYGVSRDASRWLGNFGIASCGEIHNALDAEAFVDKQSGRDFRGEAGLSDATLCVAFAGRLLPEKGADTIISAARQLAGDERMHFFIAGRGPMEQEVASAAAELGNLTYVGVLDHPDLAALLCQSDVFCFPTRYSEGLPTSLLEAGACGCALVSSRAGGVEEIIPTADAGVILDNPTATDVAGLLRELSGDHGRLASLKQGAKRNVCERFTWGATAQELLQAFSSKDC